ncbi:MAG: DUF1365 domain-containing protein [Gammaproteobacteria bacterium]
MQSSLYFGRVSHRRHGGGPDPVSNAFEYQMFMVWLDLAELDTVFRRRWFWSTRRRTLAWLRRADYFGDPAQPLSDAVRELVETRTGHRPAGPIRLLTHLRYFGHTFNPVSFYYCYDDADTQVETIVAEVSNTPWGERHCYVLPRDAARVRGPTQEFTLDKTFHVSPFLPMETRYQWRFTEPGARLVVHLRNEQQGRHAFDATLNLQRREINGRSLAAALLRFPFMTMKVVLLIYWQALKLKLKGAIFYTHPASRETGMENTR